jgi:two-component system cell cycle sensor histidine kinase/response regulator CckA
LGLSVVHGIIKDHNGFIDVQSTVGEGSVFSIYLPLVEQTQGEGETATPAAVVGGTERILIIDDERSLRFTGRKSLEKLGYVVAEAENGHQALEYFENAKRAGVESPYDLIVLDMIMEPDLDGLRTYEAILYLFPEHKAIIGSGFAENDRAKAAQIHGADWLAKPYSLAELAGAVRKRLDREA